jgi:hypothetical protein
MICPEASKEINLETYLKRLAVAKKLLFAVI